MVTAVSASRLFRSVLSGALVSVGLAFFSCSQPAEFSEILRGNTTLVQVSSNAVKQNVFFVLQKDGSVRPAAGLLPSGAAISVANGEFFPGGIQFTGVYADGAKKTLPASSAKEVTRIQAQSGTADISFLFGEYDGKKIRADFTAYIYEHDFHINALQAQGFFSGAQKLLNEDGSITISGKADYSEGHRNAGAFGTDGVQTKIEPFLISASEESYTQWTAVRAFANANGYTFASAAGIEGSESSIVSSDKSDKGTGQPVCYVSFCDAVVYCNAKSRMAGLEPVYFDTDGKELKDAEETDKCAAPVAHKENSGYRLPTAEEWVFAARGGIAALYAYGTDESVPAGFDKRLWSAPYAGAADEINLLTVCVYSGNGSRGTKKCAFMGCNALGIYDMSGNAAEWTDTAADGEAPGGNRIVMGGSYASLPADVQVSNRSRSQPPDVRTNYIGFRTVRRAD